MTTPASFNSRNLIEVNFAPDNQVVNDLESRVYDSALESLSSRDEEDFEIIDTIQIDAEMSADVEIALANLGFEGSFNLFDYMAAHFAGVDENFEDEALISLKNGQFVRGSGGDDGFRVFNLLLARTFGLNLGSEVVRRYGFMNKKTLIWKEIKEAFIAIGANVKVRDLKALFRDIKNGSNYLLCNNITFENRVLLQQFAGFEDLNDREIQILLSAFRTVPVNFKQVELTEAFFEGIEKPEGSSPFRKDFKILYKTGYLHELDDEDFQQFGEFEEVGLQLAIDEFYGKRLSYFDLPHDTPIKVLDRNGFLNTYKVIDKLPNQSDGVLGYLLAPINPEVQNWTPENPLPLQLNFRGTQGHLSVTNAWPSILRDFDLQGIGKTTFEKREDQIINMLIIELQKSNVLKANLNINGHSLGGVDVQRALALIARVLADPGHNEALDKLAKITICTHNSPGVEIDVNDNFAASIRSLESLQNPVDIEITHALVSNDMVQLAGSLYLGAGIDSPILHRRAVHISSPGLGILKAHSVKGFGPSKVPLHYEIIDERDHDKLEEAYGKWVYWQGEDFCRKVCVVLSWILFPFHVLLYLITTLAICIFKSCIEEKIPSWYAEPIV